MSMKPLPILLAFSVLAMSPALPIIDWAVQDQGAAFANNGNGNGGGNGNSNAGGNGGGQGSDKKSSNAAGNDAGKKAQAADGLAPNELGKMNGAMNANINAVLAHIRNGQVTNGPIGLLAGLAVADVAAAETAAELAGLQETATAFTELDAAVVAAGFTTVEEYLQAKTDGTLTEEQLAAAEALDGLIEAVGGLNAEGTALAEAPPSAEELLAAEEAAAAAAAGVASAETAIGDAWNKDGDLAALLVQLREKLAPYQDDIAASLP